MAQRLKDSLSAASAKTECDDAHLIPELTAVIKTFERPARLRRLLKSIRRFYPALAVIVVDDSKHPLELEGVETVKLPYDSGVSAGRREGLSRVTTKYMLNLDDDFVFYNGTRLASALGVMERFEQIDIMGGKVVDLPLYIVHDYAGVGLFPTRAKSLNLPGTLIGGMPVYDKVANFFIGRTEHIRLVDWDPQLKRLDHADFFTRAKGTLTTVFNETLAILHAKTPFGRTYMQSKGDIARDRRLLAHRYAHFNQLNKKTN